MATKQVAFGVWRSEFGVRSSEFGVRRSAFGAERAVGTRSRAIRGKHRLMVNSRCSASDRIRVPARPAPHVEDAFQTCDAGRARVQLPSEAGTPDMTIKRADADRAGARPYRAFSAKLRTPNAELQTPNSERVTAYCPPFGLLMMLRKSTGGE